MIKISLLVLGLVATTLAVPILDLSRIHRTFDLQTSPSLYHSNIYPSTYTGINVVPSVPVVPSVSAGYPVGYSGLNTGYVQPPGYYNPHTGHLTGSIVGSYPVSYNGYAHGYGWRH